MSDERNPPPEAGSPPAAPPAGLSRTEAKIRAALAAEGVQDALEALDALKELPDPAAPAPVVVVPEKGKSSSRVIRPRPRT